MRAKHAVVDTASDVRRGVAALHFRHSRGNVARRIGYGEVPVLCHGCGCETDVETPAHAPTCPLTPPPAVKTLEEKGVVTRKGRKLVTSKAHSPDGSKTLSEIGREIERWQDRQPMTVGCAVCGWSLETTVARGRNAARRHRERKHPELVGKKGRKPLRKTEATLAREAAVEERREATAAALLEAAGVLRESRGRHGDGEPASRSKSAAGGKRAGAGRPKTWTRAAIIAALQANPAATSKTRDGMPSTRAIIREFGSWSAARVAAGFPPSGRARAVDTSAASLANGSHTVRPATPEELVASLMGRLLA